MTLTFGTFFQMCICSTATLQIGRLLKKSTVFVLTQVSKLLCSFAYGSSGAAFVSSGASFVMRYDTVMEVVSTNADQFFDGYRTCTT